MANTRKIFISTEIHEIFIVHINRRMEIRGFCNDCLAEVELLTVDEAVESSGKGTFDLLEDLRIRSIHFIDAANGHVLICKESLLKQN